MGDGVLGSAGAAGARGGVAVDGPFDSVLATGVGAGAAVLISGTAGRSRLRHW